MDSMIPNRQKNTLAEYMILSGADNHPPMLDKPLYDSWKSKMELYMQNIEHGRMILESVEHDPLDWPSIEVNGVTRLKKYAELSAFEKLQADCDLKATNIILQGLPTDVYALLNHHRIAKDLWEQVQLLMQVNTKFLNRLLPEWSKFMTDVKLVRDLHTTNFHQLKAYLEQHEIHVNEVRIIRERNQDPLALSPQYGSIHPTQHYSTTYPSTPLAITYPTEPYPNAYSSTVHQEACPQPRSVPQIKYTVSIVNQQTHLAEFPQIDSGLAVPVFKQGDDPINAINKMMSFMSTFVTSRFPTTNNQCPKRKRDATWFRDKVLLVEAQGFGKVLNEEELEFLADPGFAEGPVTQTILTHNATYQVDDLDTYDSDSDDFSTAKAVLMTNLSSYGSDVLSDVPHSKNTHNDMLNQSVQEMSYSKQTHLVNYPENEITSDSNIIAYSQYLLETQNAAIHDTNSCTQQDAMILSVTPPFLHIAAEAKLGYYFKEKVFVIIALKNNLRKLKGKDIVDNAAQVSNTTTIAPGMYKIDLITLAPKDKNNREAHIYYLKHTMKQDAILREIVKQAKSLNPLDSASYSACKYVKLIQELRGYVRDTCPDIYKPNEKLVAVMPINKKKTVRVSPSTKSSRSKSTDNTKNDRILQISSSTQKKNKVEDHSRIVKYSLNKSNCVVEPSGNANVQHSKLNTNFELIKPKIAKSVISNKTEPDTSRGSNTSVSPSSSSVDL
ncbi:hypothetical protein Tco_1111803, partial [Tanacetum coccineum]